MAIKGKKLLPYFFISQSNILKLTHRGFRENTTNISTSVDLIYFAILLINLKRKYANFIPSKNMLSYNKIIQTKMKY